MVSIPACHAGDRGSIPRRGDVLSFFFIRHFCPFYNLYPSNFTQSTVHDATAKEEILFLEAVFCSEYVSAIKKPNRTTFTISMNSQTAYLSQ